MLDHVDFDNKKENYILLPHIGLTTHVLHYIGSLTTPTCNEGVKWFLNPEPIFVKKSNLKKLNHWLNHGHPSNRKIQPTNNRQISDVGGHCFIIQQLPQKTKN